VRVADECDNVAVAKVVVHPPTKEKTQ
jgi:hypothetical protein